MFKLKKINLLYIGSNIRLFATSVEFSSDGSLICIITSGDLKVITLDGKEILKIIGQSVVAASLSPKNTYLQVLTKPNGQEKNLSIRRVENGETVLEQYQKGYSKQEWLDYFCLAVCNR